MNELYRFEFVHDNAKIVCESTQKDIAKMLSNPEIKLISVSKQSKPQFRKRGKRHESKH